MTDQDLTFSADDWLVGGCQPRPWLSLRASSGSMKIEIGLSSRQARRLALDVLEDQGPYLGYQPPNDGMKERHPGPTFNATGNVGRRRSKRYEHDLQDVVDTLSGLSDEALAWALGERADRP